MIADPDVADGTHVAEVATSSVADADADVVITVGYAVRLTVLL